MSHICDGNNKGGGPCAQMVEDSNDHCEAGHENKIRRGEVSSRNEGLQATDGLLEVGELMVSTTSTSAPGPQRSYSADEVSALNSTHPDRCDEEYVPEGEYRLQVIEFASLTKNDRGTCMMYGLGADDDEVDREEDDVKDLILYGLDELPPIVLQPAPSDTEGDWEIVDGRHRVRAALLVGRDRVTAFVPIDAKTHDV